MSFADKGTGASCVKDVHGKPGDMETDFLHDSRIISFVCNEKADFPCVMIANLKSLDKIDGVLAGRMNLLQAGEGRENIVKKMGKNMGSCTVCEEGAESPPDRSNTERGSAGEDGQDCTAGEGRDQNCFPYIRKVVEDGVSAGEGERGEVGRWGARGAVPVRIV